MLESLLVGGALETLDLGANGLTGAGLEVLLPGLAACSSLKTLEVIPAVLPFDALVLDVDKGGSESNKGDEF